MNSAALNLKEHIEQKNMLEHYSRYDIIYVMLDKRIDSLSDEIKEVKIEIKEIKGEIKDLRGEIRDVSLQTNQRIDALFAQMVSMKLWGIGLLITILLIVLAPHIVSLLGN